MDYYQLLLIYTIVIYTNTHIYTNASKHIYIYIYIYIYCYVNVMGSLNPIALIYSKQISY